MALHTLADVTIATTRAALSATSVKANWIILGGITVASASIRVGDVNVTTTRGAAIAAAGSLIFPPAGNSNIYDLSEIYVVGTSNDKLSVLYSTD